MEGSEFSKYFNHFPSITHLFDGVYSIDTLPKTLKIRRFLICNTSLSSASGQHWFCLFRPERLIIECFDSLGFNQEKKQKLLGAIHFTEVKEVKINVTQVQELISDTCGKFCIFFILERLHNLDLDYDEFLNLTFVEDCKSNENKIEIFFSEMFN